MSFTFIKMMDMEGIEGNLISGLDSEEMNFMELLLGETENEIFDQ